ncbi:hypothetical protein KW791_03725 [Candidatus Parcubacteria bacterium]|nr:hypothetical protein [Candidatus Parcubacteria bacterium]
MAEIIVAGIVLLAIIVVLFWTGPYLATWALSLLGFSFGVFGLWSIEFFFLVALFCVIEVLAIEKENGRGATISLILSLLLLNWIGGLKLPTYIYQHPGFSVLLLIGYFLMGAVWSVIKWWLYTKDLREKYDKIKREFLEYNGKDSNTAIPVELKEDWVDFVKHKGLRMENGTFVPDPYRHKSTLLVWIGHWPFSALWTLINDPVKRILKTLYNQLQTTYRRIAQASFIGTENDILTKDEKEQLRTLKEKKLQEERAARENEIKDKLAKSRELPVGGYSFPRERDH